MQSVKLFVTSLFVSALAMPVLMSGLVFAQAQCVFSFPEGSISQSENCDLAIQKEVSVNGSAFVDANTSAEAAQAVVGDSVVWKISVTNPSVPDDGYYPTGVFIVGD